MLSSTESVVTVAAAGLGVGVGVGVGVVIGSVVYTTISEAEALFDPFTASRTLNST